MPHERSGKKWSAKVAETSDALDLEQGVFKKGDAKTIARSLKRSAEHSRRRKAGVTSGGPRRPGCRRMRCPPGGAQFR